MLIGLSRLRRNAMIMRQRTQSPTAVARRKPASRVNELALFASRINRALRVDVDRGVVIITPSQDLGSLRYQEIHLEVGRINDLLRHGGFNHLLIDLGERPRLETVILTALVGFCRAIPGKAAFCNMSEEIRESMNTARLANLWPIYPGREEALDELASG